ncbi:MAG: GyrI-like domain-containing protein [Alphaproteobacteria bacterium]|nr:GyrI-like domain-containing protein [Alphaproteobacteria bacterium]MDE2501289.1 GyrI-like domain-containing protein [Alphaproteobacteria bacterium]
MPAGLQITKPHFVARDARPYLGIAAPVEKAIAGDGHVKAGTLPAGRYATHRHFGGFDGLKTTTGALFDWISAQNLASDTDENSRWAARLETCHTDPLAEPDETKWETEVACKIAD